MLKDRLQVGSTCGIRWYAIPLICLLGMFLLLPRAASTQDAAPSAPAAQPPGVSPLNFANRLLRDRRYDLAASEYGDFLKSNPSGPLASEARYGLATSHLFLGRYKDALLSYEQFLAESPDHRNFPTALFRAGETAYLLSDLTTAQKHLLEYTTRFPEHHHAATAFPYLGDVLLRLDKLPDAKSAYESALKKSSSGPLADRARFGLARVLAQSGEPEKAMRLLEELVKTGGPDWTQRGRFQIASIQLETKHFAEALPLLESLERDLPESPLRQETVLKKAQALQGLDRLDEALALLEPIAGSESASAQHAAFAKAGILLEKSLPEEAQKTCDEAIARFPESPLVPLISFRGAEAAAARNLVGEARDRYLQVAQNFPKDPWADDSLLRGAQMALKAGDNEQAAQLSRELPTRFPQSRLSSEAGLVTGLAELAAGRHQIAADSLEKLLETPELSPETARAAQLALVQALRDSGQQEKLDGLLEKLRAAAPNSEVQYTLGREAFLQKRYPQAALDLAAYLEAKPEGEVAADALGMLAASLQHSGQPEEAKAVLERLARDFPGSEPLSSTALSLGEELLSAGKAPEALPFLEKAAEHAKDPTSQARARSGVAWALLQSGKPEEAAAAFQQILDSMKPEDPVGPDATLGLANALDAAGQTEKALELLGTLLEKTPSARQAPSALLARARILKKLGRPADAAADLKAYLEKFPAGQGQNAAEAPAPEPPHAIMALLGWTLLDAGNKSEAVEVFKKVLSEHPGTISAQEARVALADSAHEEGRLDEVPPLLEPLFVDPSPEPDLLQSALFRLGLVRFDQKQYQQAGEAFGKLVEGHPQSALAAQSRFWKAESAFQLGDAASAEAGFGSILQEIPPSSSAPAWLPTARLRHVESLVALKRWDDALREADQFLSDSPEFPAVHQLQYARGRALQSLARFDQAREAYQKVIDARKADDFAARAQLMRGETFFHQERFDEALREFIRLDYDYPDQPPWQAAAVFEAGKVAEKLDRWADAIDFYEQFLSRFPDDPHAQEVKDRMEQARSHASGTNKRSSAGDP